MAHNKNAWIRQEIHDKVVIEPGLIVGTINGLDYLSQESTYEK